MKSFIDMHVVMDFDEDWDENNICIRGALVLYNIYIYI